MSRLPECQLVQLARVRGGWLVVAVVAAVLVVPCVSVMVRAVGEIVDVAVLGALAVPSIGRGPRRRWL